MIRDYTQEALSELNRNMTEIGEEFREEEPLPYSLFADLPEVDLGDYPESMQRSHDQLAENICMLPALLDMVLENVHAVEEDYSSQMGEVRKLLDLYIDRVKKIGEMVRPEKLALSQPAYREGFAVAQENYLEKKAEIELLEQYLTKDQLAHLRTLGYTNDSLYSLCRSFNEDEIRFFGYLADGTEESYRKAFAINPDLLTERMNVTMADYACKLLGAADGDCTQLQLLNNCMLSASTLYGGIRDRIFGEVTYYSDVYLKKMCTGTDFILMYSTIILGSMNPECGEYESLSGVHDTQLAMMGLWTSEQIVLDKIAQQSNRIECAHTPGVEDMTYQDGYFGFYMTHASDHIGVRDELLVREHVTTELCKTSSSLSNAISLELVLEAKKEYEDAIMNSAVEIMVDMLPAVLGLICPELQLFSSMCFVASTGEGSVQGLGELTVGGGKADNAIDLAVNLPINISGAIADYRAASRKLHDIEERELARFFYIGGSCSVNFEKQVSFYGLYDPEVYRAIRIVEQSGLGAAMGWNPDEIEAKEAKIEADGSSGWIENTIKELTQILIYGGFSFETMSYVNEAGEEVIVSANELLEALGELGVVSFTE